jgi:hypothetical protein
MGGVHPGDGNGAVGDGVASTVKSKVNRETVPLKKLVANSSPERLKATSWTAQSPLPVMTPLGVAFPEPSMRKRETLPVPGLLDWLSSRLLTKSSPDELKAIPLGAKRPF